MNLPNAKPIIFALVGIALALSGPVLADNSRLCSEAIPILLSGNGYRVVETFDYRDDQDLYRVQVMAPGILAGRLVPYGGARYLRPRFNPALLTSDCRGVTPARIVSDPNLETNLIAEITEPGEYVLIVSGTGTSRAAGERYELMLDFTPQPEPVVARSFAFSQAELNASVPYLSTVMGKSSLIRFSFSEPIESGQAELELEVAGTGLLFASIANAHLVRATFSPRYPSSSWSVSIGRGHALATAFIVDGSLNGDLPLRVSLWSAYPIRTDANIQLLWIPLCGLRQFPTFGSLGCPLADLGGDLPETRRLKLDVGGRIVAAFAVESAGAGPVKITTASSEFDPIIRIRSLADGLRLGSDQDDGPDQEALWLEDLPAGEYAVEITDESGYGGAKTTLTVDQDPSFADDPDEYPDPPNDLASAQCLSGAPRLQPGEIFESGFETYSDVDAFLIDLPSGPGTISLWTLGGPIKGELRDPYQPPLPALVISKDMGYPAGILRTLNGNPRTLCLVLSSVDHKIEPFVLGFEHIQFSTALKEKATCHVPSRGWLDASIRDAADCRTAWRALIGRKKAQGRYTVARILFEEKLRGASQPPPAFVFTKMVLSDVQTLIDVTRSETLSLGLLNATYAVPQIIINHLEVEGQSAELILEITNCAIAAIPYAVEHFVTGNTAGLEPLLCVAEIFTDNFWKYWGAFRISDARREFEEEVLIWYFLDEYYKLGGMPRLAEKYGASGSGILKKIAANKRILQGDSTNYDNLFILAVDVLTSDIEPVVNERMRLAGDQ